MSEDFNIGRECLLCLALTMHNVYATPATRGYSGYFVSTLFLVKLETWMTPYEQCGDMLCFSPVVFVFVTVVVFTKGYIHKVESSKRVEY